MDQSTLDSQELEKIKAEYNSLIHNYGAEIKSVTRIVRTELESPGIMLVLPSCQLFSELPTSLYYFCNISH